MSRRVKRSVGTVFLLSTAAATAAFLFSGAGPTAQEAPATASTAPPGVSLGLAVARERAGFSGRPLVEMFFSSEVELERVRGELAAPGARAALGRFTPVLVDERSQPREERALRAKGLRVVVRSLSGTLLGALAAGWKGAELAELLGGIARRLPPPEALASPIYRRLRADPAVVDRLLERGESARAERLVGLLEEIEGKESAPAVAARARLQAR